MKPYALILDDFLGDFEAVRACADGAAFQDITNPVDAVTYPLICPQLLEPLKAEVELKLSIILGGYIRHATTFLRASPSGVPVPHQAHNDLSMGQWSLMLYLNRLEHCRGGTSLLRHRHQGFEGQPRTQEEFASARMDASDPHAWDVVMTVPMRANRALIFPAQLMHRAEPIGGFGSTPQDHRLVLTTFFDVVAP